MTTIISNYVRAKRNNIPFRFGLHAGLEIANLALGMQFKVYKAFNSARLDVCSSFGSRGMQ